MPRQITKTDNRNTANVSWQYGLCNNWKDGLTISNKLLIVCLQAAFGVKHEFKLEDFEYTGMNFAVVSSNFISEVLISRRCIFLESLKGLTCRTHDISGHRLECFRLYQSDGKKIYPALVTEERVYSQKWRQGLASWELSCKTFGFYLRALRSWFGTRTFNGNGVYLQMTVSRASLSLPVSLVSVFVYLSVCLLKLANLFLV